MTTKFIKDLAEGDRVQLEGGVGIITKVEKCPLFSTAPKAGGAYTVEWKEVGSPDTGRALQAGMDQIALVN